MIWVSKYTQTQTSTVSIQINVVCALCCVRNNNKSKKGKKFLHKPWETQIEAILKTSWIKEKRGEEREEKNDIAAPDEIQYAEIYFSC